MYWPALTGPFLLDDLAHFPKLKHSDFSSSKNVILDFIFSGSRTPGRFLGFSSLLINDYIWPTNPGPFKYTNLMLHLLNGVLLFWLSLVLLEKVFNVKHPVVASLVVMFIWLIHPIQMTTVMYVIQRFTIMASTFILLALILFLKGRLLIVTNRLKGLFWMSLGVGACGLISICFKEIGVSIIFYATLLELLVLSKRFPEKSQLFKVWKVLFLFAPIAIIAIYFMSNYSMLNDMSVRRDFTIAERMLSETRVLVDYIKSILLPNLSELTLYHDDYPVSRGFFEPFSTSISTAILVLLVGLAWLSRSKLPLLSFAIGWYFAGHLLESTVLPLELYFEHRNYIPMFGILLCLAVYITHTQGKIGMYIKPLFVLYVVVLVFLSYTNAKIWGDIKLLTNVWVEEHPGSVRAKYDAIRLKFMQGQKPDAKDYFEELEEDFPDRSSVVVYKFAYIGCDNDEPSPIDEEFLNDIRQNRVRFEIGTLSAVQKLNSKIIKGKCPAMTDDEYLRLVQAYVENPRYAAYKKGLSLLYESMARIYLKERNLDKTIKTLSKSYQAYPRYSIAIQQAILLSSAGLFDEAESYLRLAESNNPNNYLAVFERDRKIRGVRRVIESMRSQMSEQKNSISG